MLTITADACRFLRAMIVSCGSVGCFETMRLLENIEKEVPFEQVGKLEGYGYRLKAFERLERYANEKRITRITLDEMACYFGGALHIEIMSEFASHAGLANFLGEAAGLVTHVLLPLNDRGEYESGEKKLKLENVFWLNPEAEGVPFFHLGLVVKAPISEEVIEQIKEEQAGSSVFMSYLSELPSTITIPDKYYQALNCTAKL